MIVLNRERILRELHSLAFAKCNDAVKLAFLDGENLAALDRMDLSAVAEFRRHANGAVEVKLVDRLAVLEKLAELVDGQREGEDDLFRALERSAGEHESQEAIGQAEAGADVVV